jgi:hypothetical protein
MVLKERKFLTIVEAEKIYRESNTVEEAVEKLRSLKKRGSNGKQPPDGGITYMEAERKYGFNHGTIIRWVRQGYIQILGETANEVYVSEADLKYIINTYQAAPGRGRPTIRQQLSRNDFTTPK